MFTCSRRLAVALTASALLVGGSARAQDQTMPIFNPPPPDVGPPDTYGSAQPHGPHGPAGGRPHRLRRRDRSRVLGPPGARPRRAAAFPSSSTWACGSSRSSMPASTAAGRTSSRRTTPSRVRASSTATRTSTGSVSSSTSTRSRARSSIRTSVSGAATRSCTRASTVRRTCRPRSGPFAGTASAGIIDRGWEFANLTLGFDARINRGVGIGPFISASLSEYNVHTGNQSASVAGMQVANMPVPPVEHAMHELYFAGIRGTFNP